MVVSRRKKLVRFQLMKNQMGSGKVEAHAKYVMNRIISNPTIGAQERWEKRIVRYLNRPKDSLSLSPVQEVSKKGGTLVGWHKQKLNLIRNLRTNYSVPPTDISVLMRAQKIIRLYQRMKREKEPLIHGDGLRISKLIRDVENSGLNEKQKSSLLKSLRVIQRKHIDASI